MNSVMANAALKEDFLYRHKKFDQAIRLRTDSCSSTSSDGELRNEMTIARQIHPFLTQISNVNMPHFNWPGFETKSIGSYTPASNRVEQLPAANIPYNSIVTTNNNQYEPAANTSFNTLPALGNEPITGPTPVFSINQQLSLANRPYHTYPTPSNTDQYVTLAQRPYSIIATTNSYQHLPSGQRPYTYNVRSSYDQHQPLTQRICTSTETSNSNQYVLPAQKPPAYSVSTSLQSRLGLPTTLPSLKEEEQRNLAATCNTGPNVAFTTRPRSFSSSATNTAYTSVPLTHLPLTNTVLASKTATKGKLTLGSNTNDQVFVAQKPYAYTLTSASDQHVPPVQRPRAFSASTSSALYPYALLTQLRVANTADPATNQQVFASQKPCAFISTPASVQHMPTAQRPTSCSENISTLPAVGGEIQRNLAAPFTTDKNVAFPTRPRSLSASTGSSAYPTYQQAFAAQPNTSTSSRDQYVSPAQRLHTFSASTRSSAYPTYQEVIAAQVPSVERLRDISASTRRSAYTPLTLEKGTKKSLTPDTDTNQLAIGAQKPSTSEQHVPPVQRPRAFSANTSSFAHTFAPLPSTNVSITLKKGTKKSIVPESITNQQEIVVQKPSYSDQHVPPVQRPRAFSASTSSSAHPFAALPRTNTSLNLEKEAKKSLTPDSDTNHIAVGAQKPSTSEQHVPPVQRPRAFSASTSSSAHPFASLPSTNTPLTLKKRTKKSLVPESITNQQVVVVQKPSYSDQHVSLGQRPRAFSASISSSVHPFAPLASTNTPLTSKKRTKRSLSPDSNTNQQKLSASEQHVPVVQRPRAFSASASSFSSSFPHSTQLGVGNALPPEAKKPKRKFSTALKTDTDTAPARKRSFSASKTQPQQTNIEKKSNGDLTAAPNSNQHEYSTQSQPLNFSVNAGNTSSSLNVANQNTSIATTQQSFSSSTDSAAKCFASMNQPTQANTSVPASNTNHHGFDDLTQPLDFSVSTGAANTLSTSNKGRLTMASNADHDIASATRPRSFSASTGSSTSSFASLNKLRLPKRSISPPVIPPTTAILPKISDDTLRNICKYHGNMVRKFPKKERSPKDQERRNKNTIACRMSRRVKKLEHIAIEEQYKEFSQKAFELIEKSMRSTAYLHELMKLSKSPDKKSKTPAELTKTEKDHETLQEKKPFTVAYLTGTEEDK